MKIKTLIAVIVPLIAIARALAQPGPYPVIFLHGQKAEGDPDIGLESWKKAQSAMMEILAENNGQGYNTYQAGSPRDCKVNTILSTAGKKSIYNFSYYNLNPSEPGVIGDVDGRFYPYSQDGIPGEDKNIREMYQNSASNACWAEHLADFVDKVLVATGASKVNLVCHSMGGLVARYAITFYGCEEKVHKLLMIGTPNQGLYYDQEEWIASAIASDYKYQKYGELLEMSIEPQFWESGYRIEEHTLFYDDPNGGNETKEWTDWLYDYDPGGSDNAPLYGNIIGNKSRPAWTGNVVENDGIVLVPWAKLDLAEFNNIYYKYHDRRGNDDQEEVLTLCEEVERDIKHWILDYHTPPVITKIEWDHAAPSQDAMSMLIPGGSDPPIKEGWFATIHFGFNKNSEWYLDYYSGWSAASGWFWTYDHDDQELYPNSMKFWDPYVYSTGETGVWQVKARIYYSGDQYDTILYSDPKQSTPQEEDPDPGGCPELYSFICTDSATNGYLFAENNTLLPHSEVSPDTASDYYVLSHALPSKDGHYYLKVIENDSSTTFIDEIRLYAVDHPPETQVATSSNGNTYVYSDVLAPNHCVSKTSEMVEDSLGNPVEYFYSVDHLEEVWFRDSLSFEGTDSESLFVGFPPTPTNWSNTGLLISTGVGSETAPVPKDYYCVPYTDNGQGGWGPIPGSKVYARKDPSDYIVDVTKATFNTDGARTFKIVCSADSIAYIDFVALVKLETTGWSMTEATLDGAKYWRFEDGSPVSDYIENQISYYDGMFAPQLDPEEQYALSFSSVLEDTTMIRDFVLKAHGVYGPPGFVPSLNSPGLNEDDRLYEYKLELQQQILNKATALITYQIPKAGETRIEVLDVTGRRVALLEDQYLQAGSYSITWDVTDAFNRRIAKGVYFVHMVSGKFALSKKLVIVK